MAADPIGNSVPSLGLCELWTIYIGLPMYVLHGASVTFLYESRDDNLQSPRGTLFFFPYVHLLEVLLRLHVPSPRSWSHDPHFYSGAANSDTQRRASPFSNCGTLSPVIMYVYIHFSGFCSI